MMAKIKKGATYKSTGEDWKFKCQALSSLEKHNTVLVKWLEGPLEGREARVNAGDLKEVKHG